MSEPSISVVSVFVDHPPQATPVTKNLSEILAENPQLRVTGIRRRDANCEPIWSVSRLKNLELTWCVDAWSVRPTSGYYQQIIIFVPRADQ